MKEIKRLFDTRFARWGIALPAENVAQRQRGKILKRGWNISYLFGSDEGGEYLDCYASHRMTDDTHERIYRDGKVVELPAICSMRVCSKNLQEDARLEQEFFEENRKISELLAEKGFGLDGDEPFSVRINRHLHIEKE